MTLLGGVKALGLVTRLILIALLLLHAVPATAQNGWREGAPCEGDHALPGAFWAACLTVGHDDEHS